MMEDIRYAHSVEESFQTADDGLSNDQRLKPPDPAMNPKAEKFIVQKAETYEHTDNEEGLVFYERKLLVNIK